MKPLPGSPDNTRKIRRLKKATSTDGTKTGTRNRKPYYARGENMAGMTRRTLAVLVLVGLGAIVVTGCKKKEPAATRETEVKTETKETTPQPQGVPEAKPMGEPNAPGAGSMTEPRKGMESETETRVKEKISDEQGKTIERVKEKTVDIEE